VDVPWRPDRSCRDRREWTLSGWQLGSQDVCAWCLSEPVLCGGSDRPKTPGSRGASSLDPSRSWKATPEAKLLRRRGLELAGGLGSDFALHAWPVCPFRRRLSNSLPGHPLVRPTSIRLFTARRNYTIASFAIHPSHSRAEAKRRYASQYHEASDGIYKSDSAGWANGLWIKLRHELTVRDARCNVMGCKHGWMTGLRANKSGHFRGGRLQPLRAIDKESLVLSPIGNAPFFCHMHM
jgi:hypothetical protein